MAVKNLLYLLNHYGSLEKHGLSLLSSIARRIKGNPCERLVKQTGTEVAVNGTSFGVGTFKIDIGSLNTKIKEFYEVPQIMVALDTSQYLLCGAFCIWGIGIC